MIVNQCYVIVMQASKSGEPYWESPWGLGRPGWHIECSAMASDVIGETLDVHSGGNDLVFPHHTNEVAQAEAFHNCSQWVNYFFHSGHLAIDGLKMSKSLKNFITIKQALLKYSARQLRLLFLSSAWDKPLTFSDAAMETAITKEKKLDAFFDNVKVILRQSEADNNAKWSEDEKHLEDSFEKAVLLVRENLEDNFDTTGTLEVLLNLVKDVKQYSDKRVQSNKAIVVDIVKRVAIYVTRILAVFGLSNAVTGEIGWGRESSAKASQSSKEEIVAPYLDAVVSFKEDVRAAALKLPPGPHKEEFLALGDHFRDHTMVELGVRLQDRLAGNCDSAWKISDPDVLRRERDEKIQKAKEEKLGKLLNQRDRQVISFHVSFL
jgi:cysteinyl-tRNA synthetase